MKIILEKVKKIIRKPPVFISLILLPIALSLLSIYFNWRLSQPKLEIRKFEFSSQEEKLGSRIHINWEVKGSDHVIFKYLDIAKDVKPQQGIHFLLDSSVFKRKLVVNFCLVANKGKDTVEMCEEILIVDAVKQISFRKGKKTNRTENHPIDINESNFSSFLVQGRVIDPEFKPIDSVLVKVEGYLGTTLTNKQGKFWISIEKRKDQPLLCLDFFPPDKYLKSSEIIDTIQEIKPFQLKMRKK